MIHRHILSALFATLALSQFSWAQQIETDPQTGVQYQVTRQVYKRPVSETHIEQRPYTVYTERMSTEYQPSYRTVIHARDGIHVGAVFGEPLESVCTAERGLPLRATHSFGYADRKRLRFH